MNPMRPISSKRMIANGGTRIRRYFLDFPYTMHNCMPVSRVWSSKVRIAKM
jgi:hypothetical protein